MKSLVLIIGLFLTGVPALYAQSDCKCCTEKYRQFDFWVGEWMVYTPDGKLAGESSISIIQDSCVIKEEWKSASSNYTGTSYNFYDQKNDVWHQVWIDNQGGSLFLQGGLTMDNQMAMTSEHEVVEIGDPWNMISWTMNPEGTVRQVWKSMNGDSTSVLFDGTYKPKQ